MRIKCIRREVKPKSVPVSRAKGCPSRILFFDYCGVPKHGDGRKNCIQWKFRYAYSRFIRTTSNKTTRCTGFGFSSSSNLWEYIRSKTEPDHTLWVFCSELLNFTRLDNWFDKIYRDGYVNNRITIANPPTILDIQNGNRKIIFVDYRNYFKLPLLAKSERDNDYLFWSIICSGNQDRIHSVCKERCEALSRDILSLIRFHSTNKLGRWKPTISGLAWQAYTKCFNREKIYPTIDKKIKEVERSAYFGGTCIVHNRCEYDGEIFRLDVNSLYPYIYTNSELPISLDEAIDFEWTEDYDKTIDFTKCIAQVEIEPNERYYPSRNTENFQRQGQRFRTSLCSKELNRAVSNGDICKIGLCIRYNTAPILKEYGTFFYRKRQEATSSGEKVLSGAIKQYLNCIYGKWAQRIPNWIDRPEIKAVEPWAQWEFTDLTNNRTVTLRSIAGFVQEQSDSSDFEYTFTAIAAFITANARVYMSNVVDIAGKDHVFYEDTDSIICDKYGYEKLLLGSLCSQRDFGRLKLQGEFTQAGFYGIRNYRLDGNNTITGIVNPTNRYNSSQFITIETGSEQRQGHRSQLNGLFSIMKLIKSASREQEIPRFRLDEQAQLPFED